MRAVSLLLIVMGALLPGCAHAPVALAPAAPPATVPAPDRRGALDAAQALVRRGCHDCLVDALAQFSELRADPELGGEASALAVRAAVLLAVRENELGLVRHPYIDQARALLGPPEQASAELPGLIEVGELLATGPAGSSRAAATTRS